MTSHDKDSISHLIKKRSVARSTEALIGFIADSNGMIWACREFLETIRSRDNSLEKWFYKECDGHGINQKLMLSEIEKIVRLFSPNNTEQDAYSALNLSLGATQEQIKQAYRKLSLKYHPDTAIEQYREDPQKFIQISKAYRTLLDAKGEGRKVVSQNYQYSWHPQKKRGVSSEQRKKVFAWTFGLITILLIVSFIAAINFRKRTMIAGLQVSRGAFIPPSNVSSLSLSPPPEIKSSIDLKNATNQQYTRNKQDKVTIELNQKTVTEEEAPSAQRKHPETVGEKEVDIEAGKITEIAEQRESDSTAAIIPEFSNQKKKQILNSPIIKLENNREGGGIAVPGPEQEDLYSTTNQEQLGAQVAVSQMEEIDDRDKPQIKESDAVVLEQDLQTVDQVVEAENSLIPADKPPILNLDVKKNSGTSGLAGDDVKVVPDEQAEIDDSVSTVTSARKKDLQEIINLFFDNYIKSYSERNIDRFFQLFEADAIENGDSFQSKEKIYSELFKSTAKVLLKINILSWNNSENTILVKGRFTIYLKYNDQRELNGSGPIIFVLNNYNDELKVKELSYIFEEKNN